MRTQFYSIDPADTMFSAAQQLMLRNVESLMVVDESGELKGIVTERDVLLAALPQDQDVRADQPLLRMVDLMDIARERFDVPVSELMTERVRAISPGTPLTEALDAMLHQRLRRLAVVDPATNEVAGVISQRDVLSALVIGNPRLAARQTGRIRV
jgi:CBS domain-containing protein